MEEPRPDYAEMPKFEQTFCSQCGGIFGPGDSGFSHCDQHAGLPNLDEPSETVKTVKAARYLTREEQDAFNAALRKAIKSVGVTRKR
jgi:hypothetical protein